MTLFEFIQWAFRDRASSAVTIIVGWLVFDGLRGVVRAARKTAADE